MGRNLTRLTAKGDKDNGFGEGKEAEWDMMAEIAR
jgi:hypothetical protein